MRMTHKVLSQPVAIQSTRDSTVDTHSLSQSVTHLGAPVVTYIRHAVAAVQRSLSTAQGLHQNQWLLPHDRIAFLHHRSTHLNTVVHISTQ